MTPRIRPVPRPQNSKLKIQNSAKPSPVTTPEQAKQIALAYLAKKKWPYEKYLGAVRTSEVNDPKLVPENTEDLWIVCFEPKIRPDVLRMLPPSSIAIFVNPQTGEAKHIPSL